MGAPKRMTREPDAVLERLEDGHYDRVLDQFQAQLEEAAATLRRAYAAMRAENTLRS